MQSVRISLCLHRVIIPSKVIDLVLMCIGINIYISTVIINDSMEFHILLLNCNEKNLPLRKGVVLQYEGKKIPFGGVALIQGEDVKFVFIHDINIMYGMLIACNELHW